MNYPGLTEELYEPLTEAQYAGLDLMASLVQDSGRKTADASNTLAFSFAVLPTIGNFIVVDLAALRDVGASLTVGDNQGGNTWAKAIGSQKHGTGGDNNAEIWHAKVVVSAGTFTVTITTTGAAGNSYLSAGFHEVTGLPATLVPLTNLAFVPGTAILINTGAVSPTADGIVFAVVNSNTGQNQTITTPGSPWTELWEEEASALHESGAASYQVVTPGTYSAQFDYSPNTGAGLSACIAFFGDAAIAGGAKIIFRHA